jgi:hypothetical protein
MTGSDPTNLPASRAARHHPTPPAAHTDPERRTAGGVTSASRLPARAEDFTRTRPAPMSPAVKPSAQPGSAYVGSNPTPATTCENGPLAAKSRASGQFCLSRGVSACRAVDHHAGLCSDSASLSLYVWGRLVPGASAWIGFPAFRYAPSTRSSERESVKSAWWLGSCWRSSR